jgi:hypothetical protein
MINNDNTECVGASAAPVVPEFPDDLSNRNLEMGLISLRPFVHDVYRTQSKQSILFPAVLARSLESKMFRHHENRTLEHVYGYLPIIYYTLAMSETVG